MNDKPFYVYRITDADNSILYIGKGGGGSRISVSAKRYGGRGEIIERFHLESDAVAREIQLISELNPPLNRRPGGEGCPTRGNRPRYLKQKTEERSGEAR